MTKLFTIFFLLFGFKAYAVLGASAPKRLCPEPWLGSKKGISDCQMSMLKLQTTNPLTKKKKAVFASIRNGYLDADPDVPFQGNILYYQGLGDSMLNHMPLFKLLTRAGYRVIAFDYMGQGGSTGNMNDTRISEIGELGRIIWDYHARDVENFPKRTIIGWSTGGLAAYVEANLRFDLDKIVMIAPGIFPNMLVGENNIFRGKVVSITLPTLTQQKYGPNDENPHVDPINPDSPTKVPSFATDLTSTALRQQFLGYRNNQTRMFVLLSGKNDTYVDAIKTKSFFEASASPDIVKVKEYKNTLHEIDNEIEPIAAEARQDILNFINDSKK